jgi:hypothetical protein
MPTLTLTPVFPAPPAVVCSELLPCDSLLACSDLGVDMNPVTAGTLTLTPVAA